MNPTDPKRRAAAQYNTGVELLGDPARRSEAEAAFREAADSGDPKYAPLALYNLGRLLAENPARLTEALQVLEDALATRDSRVVSYADHLLNALKAALPERLIPKLAERWHCITAGSSGDFSMEEYLLPEESADNWTQILTAKRFSNSQQTPTAHLEDLKQTFATRTIDGSLDCKILEQSATELFCEITLQDDVATADYDELVRVVAHSGTLHTIQHAMRGDLNRALSERSVRLQLLRSAVFVREPMPAVAPGGSQEQTAAIIARAMNPQGSPAERLGTSRGDLARLSKSRRPDIWALLNFQIAQWLLLQDTTSESLEEARNSLRRALEVYTPGRMRAPWARSLVLLGQVEFERAQLRAKGIAKGGQQISFRHVQAALKKARTAFARGTYDWACILVDVGDVQRSFDPEGATAAYADVISALENSPGPLTDSSEMRTALVDVITRAFAGIEAIDRAKSGLPAVDTGRKRLGTVLYLRPLLSSGSLRLRNRCVAGSHEITFAEEPQEITLEALFTRVLGLDTNFWSLGGRPEGYGVSRIIMAEGGADWHSVLRLTEERSDLILMVPHLSQGVRWELHYLSEKNAIGKTLFVMPPESIDTDVPNMWITATAMFHEIDLHVPPYRPEGAVFRFDANGVVLETWSFETLWNGTFLQAIRHLLPDP